MEENILEDIKIVDVEESIKTSYLDYSMSVIIGRALPDAMLSVNITRTAIQLFMMRLCVWRKISL